MLSLLRRCHPRPSPARARSRMPKAAKGYYAVAKGRAPGVYRTWAECEAQVKGFPAAKFKKFPTEADARGFVAGGPPAPASSAAGSSSAGSSGAARGKARGGPPPAVCNVTAGAIPERSTKGPPHALEADGFTVHGGHLVVYTDGSSLANGRRGAAAGAGVFFGHGGRARDLNVAERVGGEAQTNNRGELLSIIIALESDPHPEMPIEIRTDSQYSIQCITKWAPGWIRKGWKTANGGAVKNVDMVKYLLHLVQRRKQPVRLSYVRGHVGEPGNEAADHLARTGAMRPLPAVERSYEVKEDEVEDEVQVEVDESCLMSEEELRELEKELAEQ